MSSYKKLESKDLRICFNFLPEFEYTTEISPYKDMIGQDKAIEAMELGLLLDGYNIFVCGANGTGKRSYVQRCLKEYCRKGKDKGKDICDWCYVNNFNEAEIPVALCIASGKAPEFKSDMKDLINELVNEVPKYFSDAVVEKIRNQVVNNHQKQILNIVDHLYTECKKKNFVVKNSGEGFTFTPLFNDEEMTEKQYNELTEQEKDNINEDVSELKLVALEVMRKSKIIKKKLLEELRELDEKSATPIVNGKIEKLKLKYEYNPEIINYLQEVEADIITNVDMFSEDMSEKEEQYEAFLKRYTVNIMSTNNNEIPVVIENYPEYRNLIGRIEYESKSVGITTDFTMVMPGSLHKANGGYIIIDAYQLLTHQNSWDLLKRCIKNKTILIDSNKSQLDLIPIASFKPQEIPFDTKVILLGTPYIYYLLLSNDEDFEELFNIKVNFDNEIENNNVTALKFLGFISNYCDENNLLPVSRGAVDEILKLALRRAENKRYFTSEMNSVANILKQASSIALKAGNKYISSTHIKEYTELLQKRHGYYRDKIIEMYKEGKYIIGIRGYKVGEINGLTVIDYADFAFGKQARITVATYAGKEGVINIEREVSMSGNIHNKGIMILSGYLGDTFGQEIPLSFNASICFEQLYGEVDGDSASAAELIALLSSLGNIPIKQSIAVTGSINQRGDIQPIGGVNEKIEGFFNICKSLGFDGQQGVIIPASNIDDLLLNDEVINSVENNMFHIYAVNNIEECFEILCEPDFRRQNRKNTFELVKKKVFEKLRKYNNVFNTVMKE